MGALGFYRMQKDKMPLQIQPAILRSSSDPISHSAITSLDEAKMSFLKRTETQLPMMGAMVLHVDHKALPASKPTSFPDSGEKEVAGIIGGLANKEQEQGDKEHSQKDEEQGDQQQTQEVLGILEEARKEKIENEPAAQGDELAQNEKDDASSSA